MKHLFILLFMFFFSFELVRANGVTVSAVSAPDNLHITFTVTWNNSFYVAGTNWDAVWIFVKSQNCAGTTTWDHVNLSTTAVDHTINGGLYVEPTATDGKGVFIRLNANGSGTQTGTATLKFSAANASFATTNYHVFAIEMVWVPLASFTAGDGSTLSTQSAASFGSSNTSTARTISSEALMAQDYLRNDKAGDGAITAHPQIPATFPKGYNAFYCMKYEISQQQYVAFLNDLTLAQQGNRTFQPPTSAVGTLAMTTSGANQNRNSIVVKTSSAAGAPAVYDNDLDLNAAYGDGADIACNYLSWGDLTAYLDWAALRPMSELEYEKACRGITGSVLTEFPWGNATILQADASALTNAGTSSEVSSTSGNGLCAYNKATGVNIGPLRCGFEATASTVRTTAGASYWGILDLGGNLWEQTESAGWYNGTRQPSAGYLFTGSVGDGAIDAAGNYVETSSPWGTVSYTIVRGGNWEYPLINVQVSDRTYVSSTTENSGRVRRTGGRGVRPL